MDSVIIGITSFLVTGAIMVIGGHVALTISQLRASELRVRPARATNDLEKIAAELGARIAAPAPANSPRFDGHFRTFSGFDSPPGHF